MHFIVLDCELIFNRNPLCVGLMWFQLVVSFLWEVSELFLLWPLWFTCSGHIFISVSCFVFPYHKCIGDFRSPLSDHSLERLLSCCLLCPRALTSPVVLSLGWLCEHFINGNILPSFPDLLTQGVRALTSISLLPPWRHWFVCLNKDPASNAYIWFGYSARPHGLLVSVTTQSFPSNFLALAKCLNV